MTTDITELAQREKFEAWWERTQHNGNPPRFGWSRLRDGEGYKVDDSELDGMWEAWKAASAELLEALEKAQADGSEYAASERAEAVKNVALQDEIYGLKSRIAELESRTVKLPEPEQWDITQVLLCKKKVVAAMRAAGIKWEAE
ncbi:hypothetical protein [Klebsiella michiganensis]|uniref:hypothetical protein n=1 Tax=Klebsiella michiganensis TaxID=1134687 RepID=UPI0027BBA45C|nr:hypothetical protein [Klebsiella michiganensis]MDQ2144230.1 hypothetical protein [Klebsiella michiganensis]MDV6972210.1 hypothetical protein [Klebsiella michiganensis]MDW5481617.1 hypothetical protein [Klebsiella michiganensis]MDW5495744.1 hypothetical protein [Klebsiella michiganensis]MDZ5707225.1 hypothetical protein [Klebsiella michiganensis]